MARAFGYYARRGAVVLGAGGLLCGAVLCAVTVHYLKSPPTSLDRLTASGAYIQVQDRTARPLNITYQNAWNVHDRAELHDVPEFLKTAFILSEDKRFYSHNGPDWRARSSALVTNVKALRAVRGASTISEQSMRMINPRPRTIRSRWLEGFEASRLEARFSKDEIFEFYLNQIPYAANRRGIAQAAHYYFNRDLSTLSRKEMLALAVLVRAPGRMDLWKDKSRVEGRIDRLADVLVERGHITAQQKKTILAETLALEAPSLAVEARDFVGHVKALPRAQITNNQAVSEPNNAKVKTYLDATLQNSVQQMLDRRLKDLKDKAVKNGAVLIVDHSNGQILTWVVGGAGDGDTPGRFIDAVTAQRQPGSALKPLLYSLALQKGWSAATVIDDAPFIESVGNGLHSYQNYSREFYGPVTLRQALGNSLNIPALKALQHVGAENYLDYLDELGFTSLNAHPNFYGDGIALGNGEVSLYELVQAYAALANQGVFAELSAAPGAQARESRRVMPSEIASLMGHILSDPKARGLEFGEYSILNFPVQTAVKTGTSSDYRDSWAVGFNHRYTAGVWMGNLDQTPTDGVTGSTGPALLLRSVFGELTRHQDTRALIIDPKLTRREICAHQNQTQTLNQTLHQTVKADEAACERYTEWFAPNTQPNVAAAPNGYGSRNEANPRYQMRRPVGGLHIAYDPRTPDADQAFEFFIKGVSAQEQVEWTIDGETVRAKGGTYNWPVQKGPHSVSANVMQNGETRARLKAVSFLVK